MFVNHILFFGFWVLYYVLHSLLASNKLKQSVPLSAQTYRLIYSLFSTLSLAFLLLVGASIYSGFVLPPSSTTSYIGLLLATMGLFVIKRAFRNYSFRSFMGFKKDNADAKTLKKDKVQGVIRHPLYAGTLMLFLGYFIFNPLLINLISLVALCLYLPIGIHLEEKKLMAEFGDEYVKYKENVPAIFPRLKRP